MGWSAKEKHTAGRLEEQVLVEMVVWMIEP
jgi:hypothetical protein